jgi:hypothetical protein
MKTEVLGAILILIGGCTMSEGTNYTIVETKLFEGEGFSFEYPVFKEWEIKFIENVRENEWVIYLNWPDTIDFEAPTQIHIEKSQLGPVLQATGNPQGVSYFYSPNARYTLTFYNNTHQVELWIFYYSEEHGFSKKAFDKKVIETFRFL